jgi:hypothetical protein
MTIGAGVARRDCGLVGVGFLAGGIAFPWLPGPNLPEASSVTVVALVFLLPTTALAMCVGQALFAARARTDDEPSRASAGVVATATTALCSFAVSLQLLVLTTFVDAPIQLPAPARAAMVLLGLHLVVVGNVIPRLRPGAPLGVGGQVTDTHRHAWMRTYRTAGYLCVVIGVVGAIAGASLGGAQIDAVLKIALLSASLCMGWSVRRVWSA